MQRGTRTFCRCTKQQQNESSWSLVGDARHRRVRPAAVPRGSSRWLSTDEAVDVIRRQTTHGLRRRSFPASGPAHLLLPADRRLPVSTPYGRLRSGNSRRSF